MHSKMSLFSTLFLCACNLFWQIQNNIVITNTNMCCRMRSQFDRAFSMRTSARFIDVNCLLKKFVRSFFFLLVSSVYLLRLNWQSVYFTLLIDRVEILFIFHRLFFSLWKTLYLHRFVHIKWKFYRWIANLLLLFFFASFEQHQPVMCALYWL